MNEGIKNRENKNYQYCEFKKDTTKDVVDIKGITKGVINTYLIINTKT